MRDVEANESGQWWIQSKKRMRAVMRGRSGAEAVRLVLLFLERACQTIRGVVKKESNAPNIHGQVPLLYKVTLKVRDPSFHIQMKLEKYLTYFWRRSHKKPARYNDHNNIFFSFMQRFQFHPFHVMIMMVTYWRDHVTLISLWLHLMNLIWISSLVLVTVIISVCYRICIPPKIYDS